MHTRPRLIPSPLLKNSSQGLKSRQSPTPVPSIFNSLSFIRRSQRNIDLSPISMRTFRSTNRSSGLSSRPCKSPSPIQKAQLNQANPNTSLESSPQPKHLNRYNKLISSIESLQKQNKQFKSAALKGPEHLSKLYKRSSFIKNKKSLKEFRKKVVKIKKQL